MDDELSIYGDIHDLRERFGDASSDASHPNYPKYLAALESFVEAGHPHAATALGEALSMPGPHFRPDEAYKWYYIGLSQEGYSVGWEDQNHSPPYYCGPTGDFRNESMPSELVVILGWDRVRQLDQEAAKWLADHGFDLPEGGSN